MSDHSILCTLAARWLRNSVGCPVVLRELKSAAEQTPDVIGWRSGVSILVECKTSRADFRRDAHKRWHRAGMGDWRFYLAPPGLLLSEDMPTGWGLLVSNGRHVVPVYGAPSGNGAWGSAPHTGDKGMETLLLCSALRRSVIRDRESKGDE